MYKDFLINPSKHGLAFEPITDVFVPSETVTAMHTLFAQYIDLIKKPLPKIFFYIIMQELYGPTTGGDENGNSGLHLKLK